ncbi:MAG: hypothetical protein AMXMBFR33_34620 [Candidatus Xenobia bacterium]
MVISLALVAAFTVAASASANLQVAQRVENTQIASQLAESAVQRAMARVMGNAGWVGDINLNGPVPQSTGRLTFTPGAVPFSTNNAGSTRPNGWAGSRCLPGGAVPPKRVHLVGVGRCRNVTRTVEAVLYVPDFTVSIASNGQVRLENSLVGSLEEAADVSRLAAEPELLGPADLATNSAVPNAISLQRRSRVTGNVQACGSVDISADSSFGGELRAPWTPADLPDFDLDDYDPATGDTLNFQSLPTGILSSQSLVGLVRCDGDAAIQGDMVLDNAMVYVDGDLVVEGGVRGTGAIMVKGSATVKGGGNLTSDDSIALLCDGDVSMIGDRPNTYQFQGLIYTRGNFVARNFTVIGAFIANGTGPGTGNVNLYDSQAYFTSLSNKVPIYYPRQLVLQIASANDPTQKVINLPDGNTIPYGMFPGSDVAQQYDIPWKTPAQAAAHVNGQPYNGWEGADGGPWHWYDTVLLEVRKENNAYVYELRYQPNPIPGAASYPERFTDLQSLSARLADICATMCPDYNDGVDPSGPNPRESTEFRRDTFYPQLFASWNFNPPPPGDPVQVNFSLDPNRFLNQQDKVRVVTWLEY